MKKNIIWLALLPSFFACSQSGKKTQQPLIEKVKAYYNNQKYDSLFAMFSEEMKAALPLEKTIQFFSDLQEQAGSFEKYEYKKMNQTFSQYKANFSNAVLMFSISEDATGKINGLFVAPYTDREEKPVMPRNITRLSLPFSGEWNIFWGGDTKEQNYHILNKAQKNAFDILIQDDRGKSYRTNGKTNEDYYAFGQPVTAPCDGEVVLAVDGVKDNIPGEMNPMFLSGNTVMLKTTNDEFLLLAHFKQFSLQVKQGDKVKQGQLLGLCGNSGNSSEAHLHFHIQNRENMTDAVGIKCYFDKILVNGVEKNDYSPVKGEKVKNAK